MANQVSRIGLRPEVTDIGVKRFPAGDRQEDRAQNDKTAPTVVA